jgi:hypothetical protein
MSALSLYLENKINDHVLGGTAYTAPTTVHFALFTAAPSETGGGTEISTSSTGYSRVAVTNNVTNFPASTNGTKTNGSNITFPSATAAWGTVSAFGVFDAATGGNLLYFGSLLTPRAIASGDTARFAAGDFSITYE